MSTEPGLVKGVTVKDFAAAPDTPTRSSSSTYVSPEARSDKPPARLSFEPARGLQEPRLVQVDDPESPGPGTPASLGPKPKSKGKKAKLQRSDSDYVYPWPKSHKKRYTLNATPTAFERRYPRDHPGKEIEEGARVWRLYRDRASEQDNDLFEAWKEVLDVLLVFAGLFSAICTAFIIESNKLLQPDWAEISARSDYASWASINNPNATIEDPQHPDEYVPPLFAQWANWLWFISLSLSLIVALLAILAKQWIGQYRLRMRAQVPSHRIWVWRHRALADGLLKYKLEAVIATLPPMLHLSLFVFFAGLYTFLQPFSPQLALVIGVGVLVCFGVYCILSLLLPLRYGDCPMSTPLIEWFQYWFVSGYRAAMLWVERKWPRIGVWTRTEEPAPDMTAFHEERLFRSSTIPKRNTRALLWMINHFRDCDEVSVALEAVGALSVPEHRDHFQLDEVHALRDMTIWRAHTLDVQGGPDVSDAERVGMLRTSLFLATIGNEDDQDILRDAHADSQYEAINTHDAPFLYQALVQRDQDLRSTLDHLEKWLLADPPRDLPVTAVALALWTEPAMEYLFPDTEFNAQATGPGLSLNQLAVLLICIVYSSSAADALESNQSLSRTSDFPQQSNELADVRTQYEAGYARKIAGQVIRLIPADRHAQLPRTVTADTINSMEQGHADQPWIVQSLLVWGSILEDPSIVGSQKVELRTVRAVYTMLLGHISARTLPVAKVSDIGRTLGVLTYLETAQFAEDVWKAPALLGPLDLLERVADHLTTANGDQNAWQPVSTLLAHLFAYVAKHDDLVRRDALAQRMSHIINIMGKHRTPRRAFSIGTLFTIQTLSHGQYALLYVPQTPGPPSIWKSACALRAASPNFYKTKMFKVATAIAFNLSAAVSRSQNQRSEAERLLQLLLEPHGAVTMLGEPGGRMLAIHAQRISPKVDGEARSRLSRLGGLVGRELGATSGSEIALAPSSAVREGEGGLRAGPQATEVVDLTAHRASFVGGGQPPDLERGSLHQA